MTEEYPRFIVPGFAPFDPMDLIKRTERIVCSGNQRKYTNFYATGVYGGIATGYTVGCCFRCIFCWVGLGREYLEKHGKFYSPEEAFDQLSQVARKSGTAKLRISGAEPTLGKEHLLGLLSLVEESMFKLFILETNGVYFGIDDNYVKQVSKFKKVHVRVSLKAGTPEDFTRKTGAKPEAFEIPFSAIRNLIKYGARFHVAAMSADPRIMSPAERAALLMKLHGVDPGLVKGLEEEIVDPYETTLLRLEKAGHQLKWPLTQLC
ncbi:MAG: radical SAM protein [Dehalococcoidia bacterium]|nr:MAG: radical SAM protein [Dehalococcoidia bacterium]